MTNEPIGKIDKQHADDRPKYKANRIEVALIKSTCL